LGKRNLKLGIPSKYPFVNDEQLIWGTLKAMMTRFAGRNFCMWSKAARRKYDLVAQYDLWPLLFITGAGKSEKRAGIASKWSKQQAYNKENKPNLVCT